MKILGIYCSPRKYSNSDIILNKAIKGLYKPGIKIKSIYCRNLKISSCLYCNNCKTINKCKINDDMQKIYPMLEEAKIVILATPIFFYSLPAQAKIIIDRNQFNWTKKYIKSTKYKQPKNDIKKGYLIAIGATQGKNLFLLTEFIIKYFYASLNINYEGGFMLRGVENKNEIKKYPELLNQAYNFGKKITNNILIK